MPPNFLQLEVTEREVVRNPEAARDSAVSGVPVCAGFFFSRPVPAGRLLEAMGGDDSFALEQVRTLLL